MFDLLTQVKVAIPMMNGVEWKPAVLVGRTYELEPHYDVRLADGAYLSGIPDRWIEKVAGAIDSLQRVA
jgi:hypothetical protein